MKALWQLCSLALVITVPTIQAQQADAGSLLLLIRYSTQDKVTTYEVDTQVSSYVPDTYPAQDNDPDNESESDLIVSYLDADGQVLRKVRVSNPILHQKTTDISEIPDRLQGLGLEYGHFPLRVEYVLGMVSMQIAVAGKAEGRDAATQPYFFTPAQDASPPTQQLDLSTIVPDP